MEYCVYVCDSSRPYQLLFQLIIINNRTKSYWSDPSPVLLRIVYHDIYFLWMHQKLIIFVKKCVELIRFIIVDQIPLASAWCSDERNTHKVTLHWSKKQKKINKYLIENCVPLHSRGQTSQMRILRQANDTTIYVRFVYNLILSLCFIVRMHKCCVFIAESSRVTIDQKEKNNSSCCCHLKELFEVHMVMCVHLSATATLWNFVR